jgi:predicted aldo/keto reductase-like oxidoreductase
VPPVLAARLEPPPAVCVCRAMPASNRREFLRAGAAGLTALTLAPLAAEAAAKPEPKPGAGTGTAAGALKIVPLGATGIRVSQIAFGTGTVGYNKSSNQTRRGMANFVALARHAYARGVRYFDMADSYGSQPFVAQAVRGLPRAEIVLGTKIWTEPDARGQFRQIPRTIERIRRELESDYVDILLMHCMMRGGWSRDRKGSMDAFSEAKAAGKVRAVGVSCHNWDALVEAVETPWVDVIMARVNPFGTHLDNKPETVAALLRKASAAGKGIVGMKIFGEGRNITEAERERSIAFALREARVPCMTLGMEKAEYVDDAVERVIRLSA